MNNNNPFTSIGMVTITSLRRKQISLGYVFGSPARIIAFGFGIGLVSRAPGTVASLLAVLLYNASIAAVSSFTLLVLIFASFALGVWACGQAGRDMGIEDHGGMVWDEIVAMVLVLSFVPSTFMSQAIAFALFRLFDIAKPGPVRMVERGVRGGLGVMLDDVIAAFLVLLCFTFWKLFFGWPQWISNSMI